jgi:hypothetical protein
MLQLKPGIITSRPIDGDERLPGLLSEHFGIYHCFPECGPNRGWIVYHLGTGLKLGTEASFWLGKGLMTVMESSGLNFNFYDPDNLPIETVDMARIAFLPFRRQQKKQAVP